MRGIRLRGEMNLIDILATSTLPFKHAKRTIRLINMAMNLAVQNDI